MLPSKNMSLKWQFFFRYVFRWENVINERILTFLLFANYRCMGQLEQKTTKSKKELPVLQLGFHSRSGGFSFWTKKISRWRFDSYLKLVWTSGPKNNRQRREERQTWKGNNKDTRNVMYIIFDGSEIFLMGFLRKKNKNDLHWTHFESVNPFHFREASAFSLRGDGKKFFWEVFAAILTLSIGCVVNFAADSWSCESAGNNIKTYNYVFEFLIFHNCELDSVHQKLRQHRCFGRHFSLPWRNISKSRSFIFPFRAPCCHFFNSTLWKNFFHHKL